MPSFTWASSRMSPNEGTVMLTVTVTKNEPDFVNTGARGDPTILKKESQDHHAGA